MGFRLSKIYTRTGDKGTTGLGDGVRVDKDSFRVEAFGTVDELNSAIGIVLSHSTLPKNIRENLIGVQHHLFDLGGELCLPGYKALTESHTKILEDQLDALNASLPPLKEFILPSGSPATANCHLARTICRRAERRVVTLNKQEPINPHGLTYLNRLSDLLFVIARSIAKHDGVKETLWDHERSKPAS